MRRFRSFLLVAATSLIAAGSATAATLDFDSGTPTYSGLNNLTGYAQDGFVFSIFQTGSGSLGANLFNTLYCVDGTGGAAKCDGADDYDLVPSAQGENGVAGNVLIRQESRNNGNQNGTLDDDASTGGTITFTLTSGPDFRILGFSAVDEQPMWLEVGSQICGAIDNPGNSDTGSANCETSLTSRIGVGDSFVVRYAGSGGVDSIVLTPVPIPAGFALLLTGLGMFGFLRRRRPV